MATTVMGFDFGTRKIGVAVGQSITGTASPLTVIPATDGKPDWTEVAELIAQWQPDACVVGMPYNMDGTESEMCARARKFGNRLAGRFGVTCHFIDERLSSREARDRRQAESERSGRRRDAREDVDAVAAGVLVETWLAENGRETPD